MFLNLWFQAEQLCFLLSFLLSFFLSFFLSLFRLTFTLYLFSCFAVFLSILFHSIFPFHKFFCRSFFHSGKLFSQCFYINFFLSLSFFLSFLGWYFNCLFLLLLSFSIIPFLNFNCHEGLLLLCNTWKYCYG